MYYNKTNFKPSILTQNKYLTERKFKLRWVFFVLLLPFFAIFAASGTAPESAQTKLDVETIVEDVTLPLSASEVNRDEEFWQIDQVRRNDTLSKLFNRMGVRDEDAIKFLMLSPNTRAINTQLIPGRSIEVKTNADGKLLHLEYELGEDTILVAGLTSKGYQVAEQKLILENHPTLKTATITNSLFEATDDAGIPDQIALQIADIFSSEIDFNEDLRTGDKFNVVYETFYNAGEPIKTGNVLAVEFLNNGKKYHAIHFEDETGKIAYYAPDGKSLHKSFLRSPLEFTRVSSSFNPGRFHPVLHRFRAHKGVDLAARSGTRIKASGDGVVSFIGKKGGYGNVIMLKHDNNISTVYGHLLKFATGLRKGDKVSQGDIIGYVGMSGLATGPHLHYEFLLKGVHRDPMAVALPTGAPLEKKYKNEFETRSLDLLAKIEMLNLRQIAAKN